MICEPGKEKENKGGRRGIEDVGGAKMWNAQVEAGAVGGSKAR